MGRTRAPRLSMVTALAVLSAVLALTLAGLAAARMESTKLRPGLCETIGGGHFVDIPGFPGETIDRRLLTDIRRLVRRYKIFVTDGYSRSNVHAANGEHPLGLALDIVPDKERGGTWNRIDRLAAWAEPEQGDPRAPFRWVGYEGDANHGRGHHLHLSWSHSVSRPGRPARTVYTARCPSPAAPIPPPAPPPEPPPLAGGTEVGAPVKDSPGEGGGHGGGGNHHDGDGRPSAGSGGVGGAGHGSGSGGVGGRTKIAPAVAETGGVGIGAASRG